MRSLLLPALSLSAALSLAPITANAHGSGGAVPSEVPKAPAGTEGATAEQILRDVKDRVGKDVDAAKVVAEPVESATRALERAHGARAAGDAIHARMLDGLALEWAETARELDRAATEERVALATTTRSHEVSTQVERARALLQETQGRRGRVAAELTHVETEAKEAKVAAAEAEATRLVTPKRGAVRAAKGSPSKAPPSAGKKATKGGGAR